MYEAFTSEPCGGKIVYMEGKIYINGEIGVDSTLVDVIRQVKNQPLATSFLVKIHSEGGFVDTGFEIYDYLKILDQEKPVTTSTSMAYSIASIIYMAGSNRLMPNNAENTFMIHLPWMQAIGDSNQISEYLNELKNAENKLVNFYSESLQLDKNTILNLLKNETFLSSEQCLDYGIANGLEEPLKAVAKLHNKENNEQSLMNKLTQKLDAIWNKLNGIKAELVLQDGTGISITFPDLSANDVPAIDDKALIDGKPADGEFTMPDETVYTFLAGVVSEIETAEAETQEDVNEPEAAEPAPADDKDAIIAELEAKVAELQAKIDEMMTAKQSAQLVDMLEQSIEKQAELEAKYVALAKQVGSDYSTEKKENKTTVKATNETVSRAAQILNSKF